MERPEIFGLIEPFTEDNPMPPIASPGPKSEAVKSFPWKNEVELTWTSSDGATVRERTFTRTVSASGALLPMRFFWKDLPRHGEIELQNHSSGKWARMRVVEIKPTEVGQADVTVQFV